MPKAQVDGVINGSLAASARDSVSTSIRYILIGPDKDPINVYPMK
jgi:hypothetical protein